MFMGSRLIKEKKDKQGEMIYYLSLNCIHHSRIRRSYTEGELNKTLEHRRKFYICHGAVWIG